MGGQDESMKLTVHTAVARCADLPLADSVRGCFAVSRAVARKSRVTLPYPFSFLDTVFSRRAAHLFLCTSAICFLCFAVIVLRFGTEGPLEAGVLSRRIS